MSARNVNRVLIHSCNSCFKIENIERLEASLDSQEIISLLFLLNDDFRWFLKIVKGLLGNYVNNNTAISEWCRKNPPYWREKLVESLVLIQNFKFLKALGFKKPDLLHLINAEKAVCLCNKRRQIFLFCENISFEENQKLILLLLKTIGSTKNQEFTNLFSVESQNIPIETFLIWCYANNLSRQFDITQLKRFHQSLLSGGSTPESQPLPSQPELKPATSKTRLKTTKNCYPILNPKEVGICIIVRQEIFNCSDLENRDGTKADCESLESVLKSYNIKTFTLRNLNHEDIYDSIQKGINMYFDENKHSVLFVVIMSHGKEDVIYGVDGKSVATKEIRICLSDEVMPCLKNKPKIVIVQACRGEGYTVSKKKITTDGPLLTSLSDFIICWSTSPGSKSFRHLEKGTYYIQALCECLSKYRSDHFQEILNRVTDIIKSRKFKIPNEKYELHVNMIPESECSFTKNLYLNPECLS